MTIDSLVVTGQPITWAATGGSYALTMTGVATAAARQGEKGYLGTAWASEFLVEFAVDTAGVAPDVYERYELWWGPSVSSVSGTLNPAGLNGTDSPYTGIGSATIEESKQQCDLIGSLTVVDEADTVQRTYFSYSPKAPYGCPLFVNKTDQSVGTDSSMRVRFIPLIHQAQDAV